MKKQQSNYDIFISYRRTGSFETANVIAERLKKMLAALTMPDTQIKVGFMNLRETE